MYYWIVKHDSFEDQDIISYREDLGTLRHHHLVIESLSPSLNGASFVLGRRISTEKTWRDLNDTLVTYLQSQRSQGGKEEPTLGVNIGAYNLAQSKTPGTLRLTKIPRDSCGIQEPITKCEGIILQIARRNILRYILKSSYFASCGGLLNPTAMLGTPTYIGLPKTSLTLNTGGMVRGSSRRKHRIPH